MQAIRRAMTIGLVLGATALAAGQAKVDQQAVKSEFDRVLGTSKMLPMDSAEVRFATPFKLTDAPNKDGMTVRYQVGTVDGKGAFIEVDVPRGFTGDLDPQLRSSVAELQKGGTRALGSGSIVAFCAGERVCVKTCVGVGGMPYCCKFECKK